MPVPNCTPIMSLPAIKTLTARQSQSQATEQLERQFFSRRQRSLCGSKSCTARNTRTDEHAQWRCPEILLQLPSQHPAVSQALKRRGTHWICTLTKHRSNQG